MFIESTGQNIPLFNPRTDKWRDHFEWSHDGLRIVAKTQAAAVTRDLLELNRPRILRIREADIAIDRHPPIIDR